MSGKWKLAQGLWRFFVSLMIFITQCDLRNFMGQRCLVSRWKVSYRNWGRLKVEVVTQEECEEDREAFFSRDCSKFRIICGFKEQTEETAYQKDIHLLNTYGKSHDLGNHRSPDCSKSLCLCVRRSGEKNSVDKFQHRFLDLHWGWKKEFLFHISVSAKMNTLAVTLVGGAKMTLGQRK